MSDNKFIIKEIVNLIFYDLETNEPVWQVDPCNMLDWNISQELNKDSL